MVLHMVVIKKLFIKLGNHKENADTYKKYLVSPLPDIPQLPRQKYKNSQTHKGEDQMKRSVCFGFCHFPSGKIYKPFYNIRKTVHTNIPLNLIL